MYAWPDGREKEQQFDGYLGEDGRVTWDTKFSRGFMVFMSDAVSLMRVEVGGEGGKVVVGTFTAVEEGKRVKVLHVSEGGNAVQVQHVVQSKV